MKKTIVTVLLFFAVSTGVMAQKDTGQKLFFFYPELNTYYNYRTQEYFYLDSVGHSWQTVKQLPAGYVINESTPREMVYYIGTDVWKDNQKHLKQYAKKSLVKKEN